MCKNFHSSKPYIITGGVCGKSGIRTLRNIFVDQNASILFLASYGLSKFNDVVNELNIEQQEIKAKCKRILVRHNNESEEVFKSWEDQGFEVAVIKKNNGKLRAHFKAYYTDNMMVTSTANLTESGLKRFIFKENKEEKFGEFAIPMVFDLTAPVAVYLSDSIALMALNSVNIHMVILNMYLQADKIYKSEELKLPEHEGLKRMYKDLRYKLRNYLLGNKTLDPFTHLQS